MFHRTNVSTELVCVQQFQNKDVQILIYIFYIYIFVSLHTKTQFTSVRVTYLIAHKVYTYGT